MKISYDFIYPVNDASILQLKNFILSQPDSIEHLQLNISSLGGSVSSAVTIYNYLKNAPFEITTHNLGEVTSAAVLLYLAGNERTAEQISKFVIHPIKFALNGDLSYYQLRECTQTLDADIRNYASIVNRETNSLNNIYNIEKALKGYSIAMHPKQASQCGIITKMSV